MPPRHICEDVDKQKSKEALQSPSPLAAFKACNMLRGLQVAYSKIVLPSSDSKGASKGRTYCPTTWTLLPLAIVRHNMQIYRAEMQRLVRIYALIVHF